jgi:pimeloyl-ACP methyl ester carboxylesterase
MLRIIDYARMSADVYGTHKYYGTNYNQRHQVRSDFTGIAKVLDVDPRMHTDNNFFAQLYIKFCNGKAKAAVVAIRGTVLGRIDNDVEDFVSWWSDVLANGGADRLPGYLTLAIRFYYKAKSYVRRYFPHIISVAVTGHSLGGAIAQLVTLTGRPAKAVAFNSPGCGNMPGINPNYSGFVYSVNAKYGFINKIGITVAPHLFLVDVPQDAAQAKAILQQVDKRAYRASEIDFKAGGLADVAGVYERLEALLSTEGIALQLSDAQAVFEQDVHQQRHNTDLAWSWQVRTTLALNVDYENSKALLNTYDEVIMAQHSISNMIDALTLPENVSVGYYTV